MRPAKAARRAPPIKRVAAAFILQRGKILICQRTRHQPFPLKWEFPGGKIEPGETPRTALRRELEEELGIDATIGDEVTRIQHSYPHGNTVELRFFVVDQFSGEIENRIFKDVRWVARKDLPNFDFLEADAGLVQELARGEIL
jgi:8-oxo-dGTP diphosphatase